MKKKLGSFLCRLAPLIVGSYLLFSKQDVNKKIINILILYIPLFFIVFLTSERMALIYCVTTFCFIIFYAAKFNRKTVIIFSLFIISVSLIFYAFNFFKLKEKIIDSYEQIFPSGYVVFFSEQHQVFAITSIKLFKKNPILGVGPNNYRRYCHEISSDIFFKKRIRTTKKIGIYEYSDTNIQNCSTHPHNIFFQLLSEIGLIGIIYYIIFNIFLFVETLKFFYKKNYNQISFFFLLPVIYYVNPIFPSGNFFNNWYMCFGILGLPFFLYLNKIKKSV